MLTKKLFFMSLNYSYLTYNTTHCPIKIMYYCMFTNEKKKSMGEYIHKNADMCIMYLCVTLAKAEKISYLSLTSTEIFTL